jgi:uroporphyrinogen III methyltransferase/synthase
VALVGAGPGEPSWITVAGLERLRRAQVVVFDALANPALLDHAPPTALRIDAGKRAKDHKLTQDQIHQVLLEHARAGKFVVRLKGGDPYLFGRGAEEVVFLARHGIDCEVIPGVTAGIAAPMAAGIPVTHRDLASTVTFVTGHEDPTRADSQVDYPALARLCAGGGTLCFYMGVGRLDAIAGQLQQHGCAADTPVAVVQWGTLPRQRSLRSTLAAAAAEVRRGSIGAPALIVVGAVAGLNEPGLDFFTSPARRPLLGRRILVTRTRTQASALRQQLEALGADVLEAPTIEIVPAPPEALRQADEVLLQLTWDASGAGAGGGAGGGSWLVLTSAHGVTALSERLEALHLDARALRGIAIAAVGDATAQALRERLGINADFVPTQFAGASLAGELIAKQEVRGKRVVLLRAEIAAAGLPEALRQAGAQVVELTAYQTRRAAGLPPAAAQALREGTVDWATFTSSSTAHHLVELCRQGDAAAGDEALLRGLRGSMIASIGPMTSQTLRDLGLCVTVEAQPHDVPGLVARLSAAALRARSDPRVR